MPVLTDRTLQIGVKIFRNNSVSFTCGRASGLLSLLILYRPHNPAQGPRVILHLEWKGYMYDVPVSAP